MTDLSPELATLFGVKQAGAEPSVMLYHALRWAARGIRVFPVVRYLGEPYSDKWYAEASVIPATIIQWWNTWKDADICAVPDKSGHYVVAAFEDEGGLDSLAELEAQHGDIEGADFEYEDCWGNLFFWFKGQAYTSHHKVGRGIHVLGTGHRVYLPPSLAPHNVY